MSIDVTARHVRVGEPVKDYARARGEKLVAEFPQVEYVHVILDREKRDAVAEVFVQGRNHVRVEADGSGEDLTAALDVAIEKVERQLRKLREKITDHRPKLEAAPPAGEAVP